MLIGLPGLFYLHCSGMAYLERLSWYMGDPLPNLQKKVDSKLEALQSQCLHMCLCQLPTCCPTKQPTGGVMRGLICELGHVLDSKRKKKWVSRLSLFGLELTGLCVCVLFWGLLYY